MKWRRSRWLGRQHKVGHWHLRERLRRQNPKHPQTHQRYCHANSHNRHFPAAAADEDIVAAAAAETADKTNQ